MSGRRLPFQRATLAPRRGASPPPPAFAPAPDAYWSGAGADFAAALLPTIGATSLVSDTIGVTRAATLSPRGGPAFVFDGSQGPGGLHFTLSGILTSPFTISFWAKVSIVKSGLFCASPWVGHGLPCVLALAQIKLYLTQT